MSMRHTIVYIEHVYDIKIEFIVDNLVLEDQSFWRRREGVGFVWSPLASDLGRPD